MDRSLGESPIGLAFAASHVSAPKLTGRFELVRIRATLAMQPEVEEALADCARKVPHIDHANLVRVFEVEAGSDGEGPYVVSERRGGRTLDEVLQLTRSQSRALPRPVAVAIAREVLRGLAHLHDNASGALVHGGVHPRMVVIGSRGDVRLGGLVAARVIAAAASEEPALLRGWFGYVAPEVAMGDPVDPRTDVFAAGVLAYQLVTGVLPPEGVVTPAELDDVIARALHSNPAQRYRDAGAFLAALEGVLDRAGAAHVSGTDIGVFLAELFGDEQAAEAQLPPPRLPLAAPRADSRGHTLPELPGVLEEDETTQVSDGRPARAGTGEFANSGDTLSRETDDLLALLGGSPGAAPPAESTQTNVETRPRGTGADEPTTNAGFTEHGRTYLPPPAVEVTPDVLPQGRLRLPTDVPSVSVLPQDDDPAFDERTPVVTIDSKDVVSSVSASTPAPTPEPAPAAKPSIFPNAGSGQLVSLTPIAGVPSLSSVSPVDDAAPRPAPPARRAETSPTPPPAKIQVAMAAARAMAQSPTGPPSSDTDAHAALLDPPRKERSSPVMLYLTVLALLGALFAVLWFKTDVFHPGRKKARQEQKALERENRKKLAEDARPKSGRVVLNSTPSEAAVYWLLGRAPVEVPHLDARVSHTVLVEHDGYDRVLRVIKPAEFQSASATQPKPPAERDTHLADVQVTLTRSLPVPPPAQGKGKPGKDKPGKDKQKPVAAAADAGGDDVPASGPPTLSTLRIDSVPAGSSVWMLVGYTGSMALEGLPAEVEHQFRIEAPGTLPSFVVVKPSSWSGAGQNLAFEDTVMLEASPTP